MPEAPAAGIQTTEKLRNDITLIPGCLAGFVAASRGHRSLSFFGRHRTPALKRETHINCCTSDLAPQTAPAPRGWWLHIPSSVVYRTARRRIPSYSNANSAPLNTLSSYPVGSKPHGFPVIKRAYEPPFRITSAQW